MVTGDIFAAISLVISLITVIYLVGFWKGGVDTKLNTLWQVYVMDALHNRPDLASHHSPLKITEEGKLLIPKPLRESLANWPPFCNLKNGNEAKAYEIVRCLGIDAIRLFSEQHQLSIQDSIALFTLFIDSVKEESQKK